MPHLPKSEPDAIDTAWKIHAALADWTGKVDQKASFGLAVESAALVGIISLSTDGKPLAQLDGWELWCYRGGVALLILAIGLSMAAVVPHLRRDRLSDEWRNNFIFFGHLKRWDEVALTHALRSRDILPMLSHQLIVMSDIAWKKHRRLQGSLWLAGIGTALVLLAGTEERGTLGRIADGLGGLFV